MVGLIVGTDVTLTVPAELAYGLPNPSRVRKVARDRFPADEDLVVGRRVRLSNRGGGSRSVRVVSVRNRTVVVDANHPWAGQGVELRVELVAILDAGEGPQPSSS